MCDLIIYIAKEQVGFHTCRIFIYGGGGVG